MRVLDSKSWDPCSSLVKCASASHQADIERFVGLAVTIKTSPLYHPRKSLSSGVHFLWKCLLRRSLRRLLALSSATLFIARKIRNCSRKKRPWQYPSNRHLFSNFLITSLVAFPNSCSNNFKKSKRMDDCLEESIKFCLIFNDRSVKMIYIRIMLINNRGFERIGK